ncbi:MAG: hypothetical protein OQJ93_12110 [Ignavibacteriaceae bacterium]|jgi:hypothetical protein|nr:hypothetical protein [Ignavibacteriaceae bacterium]MCW8812142.1 hypothetical protein [Chlorobium sp.]MCW8817299.1 hypothetical protein [Ignavibacteriaceae bacterium]MCW8824000.1 hypothetical protein [Ignavibacteriaceae bacterium]MCW9095302.1 hypothetical protein [Ignavibacteriaceae bacterium]
MKFIKIISLMKLSSSFVTGQKIGMKKLTISIIINSLILQLLVGCYSSNYITFNQLKDFKDKNDIIITTTDSNEYILKRDSTEQYYSNWKFVDNTIEWTESKVVFQKENPKSGKYTTINTTIAEKEIFKIGVEEFDGLKTTLLSVGILAVIVVIGALTFRLSEGPIFGSSKL